MAGYSTGAPELFQAAKDITGTNQNVQGILGQLRNTVDGLSGAWVGSAADAFNKLIMRFDEDAKKLQEALLAIAEQMDSTAVTYVQEEEAQSQEMSQIAGRLGGA
ncbi:WXG100 family type VII secretion target [Saccharothrix isguenensis]